MSPGWPTTLRAAWCARFHLKESQFPRHFLWRCACRESWVFQPWLRLLEPGCLRLTLEAADLIGDTQSWDEFDRELEAYGVNCYLRGSFAVNWLGVRLSAHRTLGAVDRLFRVSKRLPVSHQDAAHSGQPGCAARKPR